MALAPLAHVLFTRVMRHDPRRPALARPRPLHPLQRPRLDPAVLHAVSSPATGSPSTTSSSSASGPARPRAIPRCTSPPASRSPPARSARDSATASAWASPSGGSGPASVPSSCDHHTFVICCDGDLMEGISHEAASLAGHLGLGRLVYVYDDNHITIDGPTELAYNDDVAERFDAYGWHTDNLGEVANDTDALEAALRRAMAVEDRPSLILLRSHIGWPSPAQDRHRRRPREPPRRGRGPRDQGDPRPAPRRAVLGPRRGARVLPAVHAARPGAQRRRGRPASTPGTATGPPGTRANAAGASTGWAEKLPVFEAGTSLATRRAVNQCINATAEVIPGLVAGLRRPHRQHRREAARTASTSRPQHPEGAPDPLRDPRARHGRPP